jgi:hypothetical protein
MSKEANASSLIKLFSLVMIPLFFSFVLFIFSCEKENFPTGKGKLEIEFQEKISQLKSANLISSLDSIYAAVISIEDQMGKVEYEMEVIQLFNMNGSYITTPLSFYIGNYKLTDFLLINKDHEVLYACPKEGSNLASVVEDPLEISFIISKDQVTKVIPEVIKSTNPTDFGYVTFGFNFIESIEFLISVFSFDEGENNFALTDAKLHISNVDGYDAEYNLEPATNTIRVKEYNSDYTLTIKKSGYQTYRKVLSINEIKQYTVDGIGPFMVILNEANTNCTESWFNVYGTPQRELGYSVCKTHDGGFMICGNHENVDTGNDQLYLVKTDCNGGLIWEKQYDEAKQGSAIKALENGNYLIYGHNKSYDLCLLEIDDNGNIIWNRSYNQNKLDFSLNNCLEVCADGSFIFAGRTLNGNNDEIIVLKTTSNGNEEWRKIIQGDKDYRASGIIQVDDAFLIAGQVRERPWTSFQANIFLRKLSNEGVKVWNMEYIPTTSSLKEYAEDLFLTADKEIYIIGSDNIGGNTTHPKLILKHIDKEGKELWTKTYDSELLSTHRGIIARSMEESADGDLYLLGNTNEEQDILIIKVNKQGIELVKNYFGVTNYFTEPGGVTISGNDFSTQVIPTTDEGCIITGFTNAFGSGQTDMFLLKLDHKLESLYSAKK